MRELRNAVSVSTGRPKEKFKHLLLRVNQSLDPPAEAESPISCSNKSLLFTKKRTKNHWIGKGLKKQVKSGRLTRLDYFKRQTEKPRSTERTTPQGPRENTIKETSQGNKGASWRERFWSRRNPALMTGISWVQVCAISPRNGTQTQTQHRKQN